jgi:hypothetical protein
MRKISRFPSLIHLLFELTTCSKCLVAEMITAPEAKSHIGEAAMVCGTVASTRLASSSRGRPTFLNLDKSYPRKISTVSIWGANRPKFGRP